VLVLIVSLQRFFSADFYTQLFGVSTRNGFSLVPESMMKTMRLLPILPLLIPLVMMEAGLGGQLPAGGSFPEKLLGETSPFHVALFLQGDIRGSFGPCG
jgi:hypothetical protein